MIKGLPMIFIETVQIKTIGKSLIIGYSLFFEYIYIVPVKFIGFSSVTPVSCSPVNISANTYLEKCRQCQKILGLMIHFLGKVQNCFCRTAD